MDQMTVLDSFVKLFSKDPKQTLFFQVLKMSSQSCV